MRGAAIPATSLMALAVATGCGTAAAITIGTQRQHGQGTVAGALATTPFGRRAKRSATADGAQALAALTLPSGARRVTGDHSVDAVLGSSPSRFRNVSQGHVVDDMSFWQVPGNPRDLERWVIQHSPARLQGVERAGPRPLFVEFLFADQPGVTNHLLSIELAPAKSGGTAVRADGVAVWSSRRERPPASNCNCY